MGGKKLFNFLFFFKEYRFFFIFKGSKIEHTNGGVIMNIFDKLNSSMDILTRTVKNLKVEKDDRPKIEFSKFGFSVSITMKKGFVSVFIHNNANYIAGFANDKENTRSNLTARYFYRDCRDCLTDFEKYSEELFVILKDVLNHLDAATKRFLQEEKAFLLPFLENFQGRTQ